MSGKVEIKSLNGHLLADEMARNAAKANAASIEQLSEEIDGLKGNGGTGADEVVRELLEVVPAPSKNLNTSKYYSHEQNGVTFTVNADNSIAVSGTPTVNTYHFTGGAATNIAAGFSIEPGTYRLSGAPKIGAYLNACVRR